MMSDDDDKTVFVQRGNLPPASERLDQTIIVPRPGARASATPPQGAPMTAPTSRSPLSQPQAMPDPSDFKVEGGLNPLVAAASVILTVSNRLRSTLEHSDIPNLQRQLVDEIKQFEQTAKNKQIASEQILPARYLLCTMLDEIVLNAPWGANSLWSQHSLLSQFHNETGGGEKSFSVLQRMLEAPAPHLEVLELFYICISLGFQGKFKLDPRGRENLEQISNTLYQTIRNYRQEFEPDLSPHWQSQVAGKRSLMQYIPLWVVASCVMVVLLVAFSGFRVWLYQSTEPTAERLDILIQTEKNDASALRS